MPAFYLTYGDSALHRVIPEVVPPEQENVNRVYAHARMNVGELKVSYRDREIWKAERLEHPFLYKAGVYTLFMDLPLPRRGASK